MRKKKNNYLMVLVLLLLVGMSIGYAALNTTLNITGKSTIGKSTWDLYFDNIEIKEGSVEATKEPTISNDTVLDFEVALNLPGDFYEFTFLVLNTGTIDAMINDIDIISPLTPAQSKFLSYNVTYENGDEIKSKDLIASGEYVSMKVRVEFKKDIVASDLPTINQSLTFGFTMNYTQADDTAVVVRNNGYPDEITFNFLNDYTALEGMTWADYIGSDYNKDENGNQLFRYGTINGDPVVIHQYGAYVIYREVDGSGQVMFVYPNDLIIADYEYGQFAI